MRTKIINKEDFIKQLKKETALFAPEISFINNNWHLYVKAAEQILPRIPEIGFFTPRKTKLKVYDQVVSLVNEHQLLDRSNWDKPGILQLVIEYSSKSFSRASNTNLNTSVDRAFYPNTSYFKNTALLILSFVVWTILIENIGGSVSALKKYYLNDYEGKTTGVIFRSELKRNAKGGAHYDILYSYQVGDNGFYTGKKVNLHKNFNDAAEEAVNKYQAGKEVAVYYDLNDPSSSILEKTNLGSEVWFDIFGIIFLTSATFYGYRT
jgi:hypothetical protein